jgi:hypothetical protein
MSDRVFTVIPSPTVRERGAPDLGGDLIRWSLLVGDDPSVESMLRSEALRRYAILTNDGFADGADRYDRLTLPSGAAVGVVRLAGEIAEFNAHPGELGPAAWREFVTFCELSAQHCGAAGVLSSLRGDLIIAVFLPQLGVWIARERVEVDDEPDCVGFLRNAGLLGTTRG